MLPGAGGVGAHRDQWPGRRAAHLIVATHPGIRD